MAVEIIYETHSITTDNEAGIATGWLPGRLSGTGRKLARELGERYRGEAIAAVFTSDLARAVETAELAFSGTHIPVHQDSRLRECNYGSLNGMPVNLIAGQRRQHIDEPFPGGQSYRQVVEEMRSFLHDLARQWDGKTIIVISHSANRWALQHLLQGTPLEDLVDAPFNWQPGWRFVIPDRSHYPDTDATIPAPLSIQ